MSAEDDDDVSNSLTEMIIQTQQEAIKQLIDDVVAKGLTEEFAADFICLRFHPDHPWGIGAMKLNNEHTVPVLVCASEVEGKVRVVLVGYHESMKLRDTHGLELENGLAITHVDAKVVN